MPAQQNSQYQRRLELEGAPNIRDLGGYQTTDGGSTRWGRIFRAGRLSALTPRDKATLAQFRLQTICDFRREEEYLQDITDVSSDIDAQIHNLAISPGDHSRSLRQSDSKQVSPENMFEWMILINRELALHQTQTYRRMFELLLDIEDGGFLFHCSAGKDRTGFAAALILSALHVPRKTIMEDYLLTARYYPPEGELEYLATKYGGLAPDMDLSAFQAMLDTREEYLNAAFEAIDSNFESMDHYLEDELGLGPAKRSLLIQRYVE